MNARPKKQTETSKRRGCVIEYVDSLGRNTYYFNSITNKWYEKEWIRLSNNLDKETYVYGSNGYWRKHFYDIHRNILVSEIDSEGKRNLLHARRMWNPLDNELSEELTKLTQEQKQSFELF